MAAKLSANTELCHRTAGLAWLVGKEAARCSPADTAEGHVSSEAAVKCSDVRVCPSGKEGKKLTK